MASVWVCAAIVLGLVFAAASYSKLRKPSSFRRELDEYRLLPEKAVPFAAALIPLAEVAVAVGLFIPSVRALAALCAVGLLTVFTAAIAFNLQRGRRSISCACFGSDEQLLGWDLVARNGLLIALAAAVAIVDPSTDRISLAGAVVAFEAVVLAVLVITALSTIERVRRWSH
jgi:uncharacterized membrane protein YphA (DoxX/SURF4 family)